MLHKLAEELELPKLTFQVIRRTIATLAQKMGSSKDVQGFMRHETTDTTENIYQQILLPSVRATLTAIHAELSKKAEASPPPEPSTTLRTGTAADGSLQSEGSFQKDVLEMSRAIPEDMTHQVEAAPSKPVRGVILEFAPKLPPKGEKGGASKCLR